MHVLALPAGTHASAHSPCLLVGMEQAVADPGLVHRVQPVQPAPPCPPRPPGRRLAGAQGGLVHCGAGWSRRRGSGVWQDGRDSSAPQSPPSASSSPAHSAAAAAKLRLSGRNSVDPSPLPQRRLVGRRPSLHCIEAPLHPMQPALHCFSTQRNTGQPTQPAAQALCLRGGAHPPPLRARRR